MILQIRQARKQRGWKLADVAKQIGLSVVSVHDIETNRRKPSYEVLVKLEDLFGMSHRELFAAADDPSPVYHTPPTHDKEETT